MTKAYYDLLKAKEIVNLIEESLAQVEVQLKLANDHYQAGTALKTDVLEAQVRKAEVAKAESNLEQLKSRRWQLKESISLEVKEAYLDIRSAQERIKVALNSIKQAKKNLEIKESRYKEGVNTSTEVIDAEVALTTAKTNHLEAKYDYQIAAAKLIRAMGFKRGEWNEEI